MSLILFVTGCSLTTKTEKVEIPTTGNIVVGDRKYEMETGKYTYYGENMKIGKLEEKSVYEIAEDFQTLPVEKNENIEIIIEDNPTLVVNEWGESGEVNEKTMKNNKIAVPSVSGIYIYEVKASWPNGEATLIFDVEVR